MSGLMALLPPWPLLSAFLIASLLLAITPGPGVFFVVACALSQGWRSGLASVVGVAFGNLGNAIGASIGLGALFAMSTTAFLVVKYLGAAYLVFMGVRVIRAAKARVALRAHIPAARRLFRDGFFVALLNPKTLLFYVAFLPQFMTLANNAISQSILLGTLFVCIAAVTDSVYALLAGLASPLLRRRSGAAELGSYVTGAAFIALGVLAALSGPRVKA